VLPLEFPAGVTRKSLALKGDEVIDVAGISGSMAPRSQLECTITRSDGRRHGTRGRGGVFSPGGETRSCEKKRCGDSRRIMPFHMRHPDKRCAGRSA